MPKISVIVPVYNMEDKLNRCIDSILSQSFCDFELLLIDDGSKDNSGFICDEYSFKDERVKVIHKNNEGVGETKNRGIAESKGEFLTFIDSDDFVDSDYLQTLVEANSDDFDMVIAGVRYIDSKSMKSYGELNYISDKELLRPNFIDSIPFLLDVEALNYHVAKLYKRSLIKIHCIKFTDFRITGADDTVFNFDFLAYTNKIKVVNKNIYNYINYSTSTSHKFDVNVFSRRKKLDEYLLIKTSEMGLLNDDMREVINKRFVLASIWSGEAFANNKEFSYKEYKNNFFEVALDSRFREAYENLRVYKVFGGVLLYKKKCFKFFHYARHTKQKIIGNIYRLVPSQFKKIYRRVKNGSR